MSYCDPPFKGVDGISRQFIEIISNVALLSILIYNLSYNARHGYTNETLFPWSAAASSGRERRGAGPGEPRKETALPKTKGPWLPEIIGDWWPIAGNPDLGKYQTDRQQPLDFGIWQAKDGTWQLWSCVRRTACGGRGRLFYRWEGDRLTDRLWRPQGVAMIADPAFGETEGGLQAPYVFHKNDEFYMFYGDWVNICLATSRDGKAFSRRLNSRGHSGLFAEKPGTSTRDPMVMPYQGRYYLYYTAVPEGKGAIYGRTSEDLTSWGSSVIVSSGGSAGDGPSDAECPFVYFSPNDSAFYLFRAHPDRKSGEYKTSIYRSDNPLDFGVDTDKYLVGSLPFEVVRIIPDGPDLYISALNADYTGIRLARMRWTPR
jgi:hypothetical protein